jgi:hypothetical protein
VLLAGFRSAFLENARARHKETNSYLNNLHQSVHSMLAELREAREDATNGVRATLKDYMEDLHANVADAKLEADAKLRDVSKRRQKAAREAARTRTAENEELKGHSRQQLDELADSRHDAEQSLHGQLDAFTADLHDQVAQVRRRNRREIGIGEPAHVKAKPQRKQASRPQVRKEEPNKKSASPKGKKPSVAMATKTPAAKAKPQANAKKPVKTVAGAQSRKRRVH